MSECLAVALIASDRFIAKLYLWEGVRPAICPARELLLFVKIWRINLRFVQRQSWAGKTYLSKHLLLQLCQNCWEHPLSECLLIDVGLCALLILEAIRASEISTVTELPSPRKSCTRTEKCQVDNQAYGMPRTVHGHKCSYLSWTGRMVLQWSRETRGKQSGMKKHDTVMHARVLQGHTTA